MADISKEIQNFRTAKKGKEVRGSMISLAEKVNREVENNTGAANAAAANAAEQANRASLAADMADRGAVNANDAAANAAAVRQNILDRLAAGEFKGAKGDKGNTGPQGSSGVMAPSSGMFSLFLDPSTGNLYAEYPDGETAPNFQYDASTGDLYYVTG